MVLRYPRDRYHRYMDRLYVLISLQNVVKNEGGGGCSMKTGPPISIILVPRWFYGPIELFGIPFGVD